MAVVKMSKLKLIALESDRERILDVLHKSKAVELTDGEDVENTFTLSADEGQDLKIEYQKISKALEYLTETLSSFKKTDLFPKGEEGLSNDIIVSYDEFMAISDKKDKLISVVNDINDIKNSVLDVKSTVAKNNALLSQLETYKSVEGDFSDYVDTAYTKSFLGAISESALSLLKEFLAEKPLSNLTVFSEGATSVIHVVSHTSESDEVAAKLNELAFIKCPFVFACTPSAKILSVTEEQEKLEKQEETLLKNVCSYSKYLKDLKIFSDFYKFSIEKHEVSDKCRRTEKTFVLFGYVPTPEIDFVKNSLSEITPACYTEFSEPTEEDEPPTLLKNNNAVKQVEFVTNMYSVPNYREYDPNTFVFVFFMIFFGFMMADIGYGVLLFALCMWIRSRYKVDNGTRRLFTVIAYGGIFTVIFGLLFGSCFGFPLYHLMPDPTATGAEGRINVLVILLACLGVGLFHLVAGYLLKAVNEFRNKNYVSAIFDGLTWVFFNIGLFFAVFNFLTDYFGISTPEGVHSFFAMMQMPGIITLLVSLTLAAVTAGRAEKGFGKITKGFGAVYGIIGLLSDILSYARLFGLMISGMIIAQQFNGMGTAMFSNGVTGYIFGGLIILVGHVFNIAMNVLGVYIHDCRLQYIEFFSKFYTGEGRLFTSFGSEKTYTHIK